MTKRAARVATRRAPTLAMAAGDTNGTASDERMDEDQELDAAYAMVDESAYVSTAHADSRTTRTTR